MRCPIIYCGDNRKQKQKQVLNCEIICDEENQFLLNETQECVNYCDIDKMVSGACITKYKGKEVVENNEQSNKGEKEKKEEEIKLQDKLLDNVEKGFTSESYNTSDLDNGKEQIIQNDKMTITLTTSDNQKDNKNNNMTTIDLGECEVILRKDLLQIIIILQV